MSVVDVIDLDLPLVLPTDPEYLADPDGVWRRARDRHWLARTDVGFVALTHDAVRALNGNRALVGTGDTYLRMQGITSGVLYDYWTNGLLAVMSGERHHRLRTLMVSAFTPRVVNRLRPAMRAIAGRLVEGFAEAGGADLVPAFAHRYPIEVTASVIGIPDSEIDAFAQWSTDLGLAFSLPVAPVQDRVEAAIAGLRNYVGGLVDRARARPRDDLVSRMVAPEDGGDRLSHDEVVWQLLNLVFAGHDSTRGQLGYLLDAFGRRPWDWQRVADDPGLVPNAVAESMRMHPAIRGTIRVAATEVAYSGVRFSPGTVLILSSAAANRDPRVFPDPDTFDIDRPNAANHVTLGGGVHYCLGAYLARTELAEALPILAAALPGLRAAGEARWRPYSSAILGADALPMAWDVPTMRSAGIKVRPRVVKTNLRPS
jgi:cytochrome P450